MTTIFQSIFSTKSYTSQIDRLKAIFIYALLGMISIVMAVVTISGVSDGGVVTPIIPLTAFVLLTVVFGLVRSRQLQYATWILTITLMIAIIANNVLDTELGSLALLLNIVLLIIAGFLNETPGIVLITASNIIQVFAIPTINGLSDDNILSRVTLAVVYLITGVIVYTYNQYVKANRIEGRDVEGFERLKLADVNMRITRQASARDSLDNALNSTLKLILDNYPQIYHAQVFLIDSDGIQAKLVASTGDAGKTLMARDHSLAVGSLSVIGQTTLTGKPIIARTGDKDSVHRVNELLPDTILEVAFPLRVGEEIIGALDLQSTELQDLSENDRLTFQSLANSLSLAIDSIQQFDQARTRIDENQRLTEQTRTALREVERLNQRLIGRAWTEYAKGGNDRLSYGYDFVKDEEDIPQWTQTLSDAVSIDNFVQEGNVIAIPLRVRGQVIGAMEFELDENQEFTPEDLELITEVSERFGLAAENTRLVEESQRQAQREALINQMTSSFQSAQNVEATLAEAARSLSETLSADKVMIRLGVPDNSSNGKES